MKKYLFILLLFFTGLVGYAQKPEAIVGEWLSEKKNGKIQIFRRGNQYFGRLSWIDDPSVLDASNPDAALRSRRLMGTVILTNFTFDNNRWENGQIYDPESGKTYACVMQMTTDDILKIRGYVGFSLLGRTSTWGRVKPPS